jgi:predicted amidohydrolase YtcJ
MQRCGDAFACVPEFERGELPLAGDQGFVGEGSVETAILSTRVFTGNPARPWAEALAIRDDRILAAGNNAEVKNACGRDARVFVLPGRLVTPGIVDAHLHFVNFGISLQQVNLRNLPSIEECRQRVAEAVAASKPGEWIIGRGWSEHIWKERRTPKTADLDDITPHHPVMLVRHCGHTVWLNSLAMARARITRAAADAPGARIERDPCTGEPTGLLHEYRKIIEKEIPPPTLEARKEAALRAQYEALRFGVTGVHSCETLQEWEALAALEGEGKLKLRIHHLLPPEEVEKARALGIELHKGSERLWFGQVKLYADGTLGSGTALLHEPYTDNPALRGIAVLTSKELQERVEFTYRNGGDVGVHAIGDLAVTNVLKAIQGARKRFSGPRRDRIEHVQLFHPDDLPLFRDLGVVASVQPVHLLTDRPVAEKRWGLPRCRHAYAWKSLLQAGMRLQFGSDAPVESINPLLSFHAALMRQSLAGEPKEGWFPDERLTLDEVIHAFTAVPAWVSRKEEDLGNLIPGKKADLVVFSKDLFQVAPSNLTPVDVEMTMVNGELLYQKDARNG